MGILQRLMRMVLGPDDAGLVNFNREDWLTIIEQNVAQNSRMIHQIDFNYKTADFNLAAQGVTHAKAIEQLRNETSESFRVYDEMIKRLSDRIIELESRLGDHETRFASRTDLLAQPSTN